MPEFGETNRGFKMKGFSPFTQTETDGGKDNKKQTTKETVPISKKPDLKNWSMERLMDSLHNMPQRNQADFKKFAAIKNEVLRRNPNVDWGENVDELD